MPLRSIPAAHPGENALVLRFGATFIDWCSKRERRRPTFSGASSEVFGGSGSMTTPRSAASNADAKISRSVRVPPGFYGSPSLALSVNNDRPDPSVPD